MEESDQSLVERYRRGDVDALRVLVERYERPLFGFIVNTIGSAADADEIFQEVWFRAIRKLDSYEHGNLLGWLIRISRNLVVDRSRGQKRLCSLERESEEGGSLADAIPAPDRSPSDAATDRDLGLRIKAAVSGLPPEQQEVFLLRAQTDLPFREIARIQGVSINTALARMQYAVAKLRAALKEDYGSLGG